MNPKVQIFRFKETPQRIERICISNIAKYILQYNYYDKVFMTDTWVQNFEEIMFALYKNGLPAQLCINIFKEIMRQIRGNKHPFFCIDLSEDQFEEELMKSPIVKTIIEVTEGNNKKLLDEFFDFNLNPPFDRTSATRYMCRDYGEFNDL